MSGGLPGILSRIAMAPSFLATYEGCFHLWNQWRCLAVGKAMLIDPTESPEAIGVELGKFLVSWHFSRGTKLSTAVG